MSSMRRRIVREKAANNRKRVKSRRSAHTMVGRKKWKPHVPSRLAVEPAVDHSMDAWIKEAYDAGGRDASLHQIHEAVDHKRCINQYWSGWFLSNSKSIPWRNYGSISNAYLDGYSRRAGIARPNWVLIPTNRTVGVIVMVMNEEHTITGVIEQLQRLPLNEMIVIVNGSTDNSFSIVRKISDAMIVHYSQPLGHDVGRAIGANLAYSDILLFLDGDMPIYAEHLVPFIYGIEQGLDIALNDITPFLGVFSSRDSVTIMKEFINRSMGRPDLQANSLTAVPHALSRKAVEEIGCKHLIVPPKAQTIAIRKGLNIGAPQSIDVITKNRIRDKNVGSSNPVADMIVGDHLEALELAMKADGERLALHDSIRNRSFAGGSGN